jgi:hypothetical protein
MEVYLLSLPLARHRAIPARPRRAPQSSAFLGAPEPTSGIRDAAELSDERQAFSPTMQRIPR